MLKLYIQVFVDVLGLQLHMMLLELLVMKAIMISLKYKTIGANLKTAIGSI